MAHQGRYWILTVPHADFVPYLPVGVSWIKGQLELGAGGFLHWQFCCAFPNKLRLRGVKLIFGDTAHCEVTRSAAAEDYVEKDETAVDGTRFELGARAVKRASSTDWDNIRELAKKGRLDDIPADIYIRCNKWLIVEWLEYLTNRS